MTALAPPPLPDLDALAVESAWLAGREGLAAELPRLRAHADREIPRLSARAARLAHPRARAATLLALGRTLLRFLRLVLLGLAGEACGRAGRRLRRGSGPARGATSSPAVRRA